MQMAVKLLHVFIGCFLFGRDAQKVPELLLRSCKPKYTEDLEKAFRTILKYRVN
jgi:hypothetical protein